jgi:hypothetical protein
MIGDERPTTKSRYSAIQSAIMKKAGSYYLNEAKDAVNDIGFTTSGCHFQCKLNMHGVHTSKN